MSLTKFFHLILAISTLSLLAFTSSNLDNSDDQNSTWKAPKEADELKNPLAENGAEFIKGKKLYNQMCAVCHGAKGKGDGVAGAALNPKPTNFNGKCAGPNRWSPFLEAFGRQNPYGFLQKHFERGSAMAAGQLPENF